MFLKKQQFNQRIYLFYPSMLVFKDNHHCFSAMFPCSFYQCNVNVWIYSGRARRTSTILRSVRNIFSDLILAAKRLSHQVFGQPSLLKLQRPKCWRDKKVAWIAFMAKILMTMSTLEQRCLEGKWNYRCKLDDSFPALSVRSCKADDIG